MVSFLEKFIFLFDFMIQYLIENKFINLSEVKLLALDYIRTLTGTIHKLNTTFI
jgi:hypothetical protein